MKNKLIMSLVLVSVALSFACAKKNKPDQTGLENNVLGRDAIQDKDLDFTVSGSDSGKITGLYTVHFDYDKSNLTEEAKNLLVKDAAWLKQNPKKSIQIEGHCDRHGSIEYNLALGERRANSVKHYLINLGVSHNRVSTISYGKEKLLNSAETEEADAMNRRANFKPLDSAKVKMSSR